MDVQDSPRGGCECVVLEPFVAEHDGEGEDDLGAILVVVVAMSIELLSERGLCWGPRGRIERGEQSHDARGGRGVVQLGWEGTEDADGELGEVEETEEETLRAGERGGKGGADKGPEGLWGGDGQGTEPVGGAVGSSADGTTEEGVDATGDPIGDGDGAGGDGDIVGDEDGRTWCGHEGGEVDAAGGRGVTQGGSVLVRRVREFLVRVFIVDLEGEFDLDVIHEVIVVRVRIHGGFLRGDDLLGDVDDLERSFGELLLGVALLRGQRLELSLFCEGGLWRSLCVDCSGGDCAGSGCPDQGWGGGGLELTSVRVEGERLTVRSSV